VGTPPPDHRAADRGPADQAGLPGSPVDAVLELEEAGHPVGVHVVGDRGAAQSDGFPEDCLEGGVEAAQLVAGEAACHSGRADSGAEEGFVGVDVPNAMEEPLVEQGGLDGEASTTEECCEVLDGDGERLAARALKASLSVGGAIQCEAAEAAGVHEAEFAARAKVEDRMGVRWDGNIGRRDKETSSHAEVDDPLSLSGVSLSRVSLSRVVVS